MRIKKGHKVVCIEDFNGVPTFGVMKTHHNPPKKGEVFTVLDTTIEQDGGMYLVLGEVTNNQKHRGANDVWASRKFKVLEESQVKTETVEQLDQVLTELCINYT